MKAWGAWEKPSRDCPLLDSLDDQPLWDSIGLDARSPSLSLLPKFINTLARLLATASMPPCSVFLLLRVYCGFLNSAKYALYFYFPQFLSKVTFCRKAEIPFSPQFHPKLQCALSLGCNGLPAKVTTLQLTNCSLRLLSSHLCNSWLWASDLKIDWEEQRIRIEKRWVRKRAEFQY